MGEWHFKCGTFAGELPVEPVVLLFADQV